MTFNELLPNFMWILKPHPDMDTWSPKNLSNTNTAVLLFKFILTHVIPKQTGSRVLSSPVTLPVFISCVLQKGCFILCLWLGAFDHDHQSMNHICQQLVKLKPKL